MPLLDERLTKNVLPEEIVHSVAALSAALAAVGQRHSDPVTFTGVLSWGMPDTVSLPQSPPPLHFPVPPAAPPPMGAHQVVWVPLLAAAPASCPAGRGPLQTQEAHERVKGGREGVAEGRRGGEGRQRWSHAVNGGLLRLSLHPTNCSPLSTWGVVSKQHAS